MPCHAIYQNVCFTADPHIFMYLFGHSHSPINSDLCFVFHFEEHSTRVSVPKEIFNQKNVDKTIDICPKEAFYSINIIHIPMYYIAIVLCCHSVTDAPVRISFVCADCWVCPTTFFPWKSIKRVSCPRKEEKGRRYLVKRRAECICVIYILLIMFIFLLFCPRSVVARVVVNIQFIWFDLLCRNHVWLSFYSARHYHPHSHHHSISCIRSCKNPVLVVYSSNSSRLSDWLTAARRESDKRVATDPNWS